MPSQSAPTPTTETRKGIASPRRPLPTASPSTTHDGNANVYPAPKMISGSETILRHAGASFRSRAARRGSSHSGDLYGLPSILLL